MKTKVEHLSARWQHAEREGVSLGKLGRGDITSWARPTTSFQRPEVGKVVNLARHIHSLKACDMKPVQGPQFVEPITLPADSKPDPRLDMGRAAIISNVNERLHNFIVTRKKATGKPIEMPKPSFKSVLDDCPRSFPEGAKGLGGPAIEREVEPHTDDPLPYDRPCKSNNWRR